MNLFQDDTPFFPPRGGTFQIRMSLRHAFSDVMVMYIESLYRLYRYTEDPMNGRNGALVSSREFYVLGW